MRPMQASWKDLHLASGLCHGYVHASPEARGEGNAERANSVHETVPRGAAEPRIHSLEIARDYEPSMFIMTMDLEDEVRTCFCTVI